MTVMQVIPNLGAGGAEQTCVDVTEALVKVDTAPLLYQMAGHV